MEIICIISKRKPQIEGYRDVGFKQVRHFLFGCCFFLVTYVLYPIKLPGESWRVGWLCEID